MAVSRAWGRYFATETAMIPLPVPTSQIDNSGSWRCLARSNRAITRNSVSGRGISTAGVTRNESE